MAVRPGYIKTEVGGIPVDWQVKSLGEMGDALIGLTYTPGDVQTHGRLVLRSSNIQNDSLAFDDNVYVACPVPDRILVRPGDVLICVRNGSRSLIGKSALLDSRVYGMTFGAFMAVYRSRIGTLVKYLFQSDILRRQINEHLGATINQITNKSLNSFLIPLPPTDAERASIETALGAIDALLAGLDRLIAKKRDLKQAAMQQLLTGRTRLPGFQGEWETASVADVVTTPITDGPHSTPKFLSTGVPFLSVNNLVSNRLDFDSPRFISPADHIEFSKKCKPRRGDILFGKAASVGMVALVETDADFNIWSPLALIRVWGRMSERFVFYALQGPDIARQIKLLTNASSQGNIGMSDIGSLRIPKPALGEQEAIATLLSDMDNELIALEARRDKSHALKQGMMQELLTGRTRLV